MASSSSDDGRAPEKFRLSSNEDVTALPTGSKDRHTDDAGGQRRLKCLLCGTLQRNFHCRGCVKNGNVLHSATAQCGAALPHQRRTHAESLAEKQQRYLSTHGNLTALRERYDNAIQQRKVCENVQLEIKRKREELQLLRQLNDEKRTALECLMERRNHLQHSNDEKRKHLPKYPIKVKSVEDTVLDIQEKMVKLRDTRQSLMDGLQQRTRHSIQQLVDCIFPISEVVLKDERRQNVEMAKQNHPEDSETIAALDDAKNTSYIRGKWVIHGSGISEMQYRIVAPSLPANGDYTAYIDWLSEENKDAVPRTTANEITPSRVSAYRIAGALTYTTQLTQLMSYYLNVRLPFKLAYGDFCRKLNEDQFKRKVSRLNSNIMYLAYTQQVQLRTLNEHHTLENMLAILDVTRSDLGRHGYHEVGNEPPLQQSIDSVLLGIETATESESEDEHSLRLDWEAVPNHTEHQTINIINSHQMPSNTQQSTIAHGLMTSAANKLTAMFRWHN